MRYIEYLVPLRDTEGEDHVSTSSMASLVVVIVDEDKGVSSIYHTPALAEVDQPLELVLPTESLAQELSVFKLCDATIVDVLQARDGFSSCRSSAYS